MEDISELALPGGSRLASDVDGAGRDLANLVSVAPIVKSIRTVGLALILLNPVDIFDEFVVISPCDDGLLDSLAFDIARAIPTDPLFDRVISDLVLHATEAINSLSTSSPLKG